MATLKKGGNFYAGKLCDAVNTSNGEILINGTES
jgi:hypothetical protein